METYKKINSLDITAYSYNSQLIQKKHDSLLFLLVSGNDLKFESLVGQNDPGFDHKAHASHVRLYIRTYRDSKGNVLLQTVLFGGFEQSNY